MQSQNVSHIFILDGVDAWSGSTCTNSLVDTLDTVMRGVNAVDIPKMQP